MLLYYTYSTPGSCDNIFPSGADRGPTSIHHSDVIMSMMAFQITGVSIVCSTVCSGAGHKIHQSSASLAFVRGIHRSLVDSPHKGTVTRKMFPFDDVIMLHYTAYTCRYDHVSFLHDDVVICKHFRIHGLLWTGATGGFPDKGTAMLSFDIYFFFQHEQLMKGFVICWTKGVLIKSNCSQG